MAEKKSTSKGSSATFTAEERAAMRARVKELKAQASKEEAEQEVLRKIAEMEAPSRAMAQRLHKIIKATAPGISSKTWYGMPAYWRDERVICFFRPAEKFGTRYSTLGFSDEAKLDDGHMWPTDFALTELTSADEARIIALVKQAVG
jgi:hypothetical protein